MRICIQLDDKETAARVAALAKDPDAFTDHGSSALAEEIWRCPMAGKADGVDLCDFDGTYLYTIVGDAR